MMNSKHPVLTISSAALLGISLFINWFLIAVLLSGFFPKFYFPLSVALIFALAGFSLTPQAESIARFCFGCRKPTRHESSILEGPWNAVIKACGLADRQYKPEVFVADHPYPQAFAVGLKTVCVTRGLLNMSTPEELAGVLAHEIGHLENGDTKWRMIATVVNAAGNVAAAILTAILVGLGLFMETAGTSGDRTTSHMTRQGLTLILFALLLKACLWIIQWLISLGFLAVGRKEELAADEFAKKAGFAQGLASLLMKTEHLHLQPAGLWAAITRSHPPVAERVDRLLDGSPAVLGISNYNLWTQPRQPKPEFQPDRSPWKRTEHDEQIESPDEEIDATTVELYRLCRAAASAVAQEVAGASDVQARWKNGEIILSFKFDGSRDIQKVTREAELVAVRELLDLTHQVFRVKAEALMTVSGSYGKPNITRTAVEFSPQLLATVAAEAAKKVPGVATANGLVRTDGLEVEITIAPEALVNARQVTLEASRAAADTVKNTAGHEIPVKIRAVGIAETRRENHR